MIVNFCIATAALLLSGSFLGKGGPNRESKHVFFGMIAFLVGISFLSAGIDSQELELKKTYSTMAQSAKKDSDDYNI